VPYQESEDDMDDGDLEWIANHIGLLLISEVGTIIGEIGAEFPPVGRLLALVSGQARVAWEVPAAPPVLAQR
jgi:hypothetical protein